MNLVPTDSVSIYEQLSTLTNRSRRLALVRPNNPPSGIAGFLLDIVEDDGSDLESDITDHYVEDNTTVQDHIALRPETITVSGRVAELVRAIPVAQPITQATNPLPLIPDLMPTLAPGSQEREVAELLAQTEGDAVIGFSESLYGFYQSNARQQPGQTKQSYIYGYFYQLWKGRQLFSVETPWGIFENMAILSASVKQGAESRSVSEFSLTFKKIRVAQTINAVPGLLAQRSVFDQSVANNANFLAGRSAFEWSAPSNNGLSGQTPMTAAETLQFNWKINPTRL